MFHVFAALAEFLRELIVDGTREGLAAAKANGVRLGRPSAMTPEQIHHARALLAEPDTTVASIARSSACPAPPSTNTSPNSAPTRLSNPDPSHTQHVRAKTSPSFLRPDHPRLQHSPTLELYSVYLAARRNDRRTGPSTAVPTGHSDLDAVLRPHPRQNHAPTWRGVRPD
nr:hypothetical protein [Actinopolyspora mortivallis]